MSRKWIQRALRVGPHRRRKGAHHRKAVRVEALHKGALHRMLGVPEGEMISLILLQEAVTHPERFYEREREQRLLRLRAQFAINVRGLGRRS